MNICFFLPTFLPKVGGLEKAADRLASLIHERGHSVVVLTQIPRKVKGTVTRPYPIDYYPRPRSKTWFPFSMGSALNRLHDQYTFDIIVAFHSYPQGYIACRFGRKRRVPVIIALRGNDFGDACRYFKKSIARKRILWAMKAADSVITLSRQTAQDVSLLTENAVKPSVIHNGVEIPEDQSAPDSLPSCFRLLKNTPFLLTLGRLRECKGLDVLLEAVKCLRDQKHSVPHLVIAGDGRELENLKRQAVYCGLNDCVSFPGLVEGREKGWLLYNCMCLVQPSISEGMPNTVLEAMSYGKPVLGTTIGGIVDIVKDGENGVLVEANNPDALAEGLKTILSADLSEYGRRAGQTAQEHSWDSIAVSYIDVFESVLSKEKGLV